MTTTTIQIKRKNLRLLETLKAGMGAKSYDEVIERLIFEKMSFPNEMFGIDKGECPSF